MVRSICSYWHRERDHDDAKPLLQPRRDPGDGTNLRGDGSASIGDGQHRDRCADRRDIQGPRSGQRSADRLRVLRDVEAGRYIARVTTT